MHAFLEFFTPHWLDQIAVGISAICAWLILQKEKGPVEAEQMFQEGLRVALDMGEKWIIQQSLVNLGFSKYALREVTEAQDCFLRALRLAFEAKLMPCILDSLAGIAWIYAGQEKEEIALELAIQVENHPAVTQDTKDRATQLRAELGAQLTSSQIEAIQAQAGSKPLEEVVEDLLK